MSWIRCAIFGHSTMHPRRARDGSDAIVRGALELECASCGRVWPVTVDFTPSWSLLARLRRQTPWARERSRRSA